MRDGKHDAVALMNSVGVNGMTGDALTDPGQTHGLSAVKNCSGSSHQNRPLEGTRTVDSFGTMAAEISLTAEERTLCPKAGSLRCAV